MTLLRYLLRNLLHHRRGYYLVAAGTALATAIITGALVVGDSVRFSLASITDERLGGIGYSLQSSDRWFRAVLADSLQRKLKIPVAPVLSTEGIAINPDRDLRINRVTIQGIDARLPAFWENGFTVPGPDSVVISRNVADRLELKPGATLLVRMRKTGLAPSGAPFVENDPSVALRLTVSGIAEAANGGGFSLLNNQSAPFNLFVRAGQMAALLGVDGRVNTLLAGGEAAPGQKVLDSVFADCRSSADAGFHITGVSNLQPGSKTHPGESETTRLTWQISSDRVFLDEPLAQAVSRSIPGSRPVLTYLVNSIRKGTRSTPYSFVTAINDPALQPPVREGEIVLNAWLADDLAARPGDTVTLRYFVMGPRRSLRETETRRVVSGIIPVDGIPGGAGLMPPFPGMSDAGNCRDWETGAPVDLKQIREKDEKYWQEHRGTPKAFLSPEDGKNLWQNRFGSATSFRFEATAGEKTRFEEQIVSGISPRETGLFFRPVREEAVRSAEGSTDFGQLFLGLSFFILLSALLLSALLFSGLAGKRRFETSVLTSLGFRGRFIRRVLMTEAALVAVVGAIPGLLAGIVYNQLLIIGLNTLWQDAVNDTPLRVRLSAATLASGLLAGLVVSMGAFFFVLLKELKKQPGEALRGAEKKRVRPVPAVNSAGSLAIRNLRTRPAAALTAATLLALGVMAVAITGVNRKTGEQETDRRSGSGGFLLWGETAIPLHKDLNSAEGRKEYGLDGIPSFDSVRFIQLSRLGGDDASCLNLNRTTAPGLLGVPVSLFDSLEVFSFVTKAAPLPGATGWSALLDPPAPEALFAVADQTVITWGLGKKPGDTLLYVDESGRPLSVILAGGLKNSLFQGYLLVSDSLLRHHFPSVAGTSVILVDGPPALRDTLVPLLTRALGDQGLMITPATQRLKDFNRVENTYLAVFLLLGGLGILIGTAGFGIVLHRNVEARSRETAILFALGIPVERIVRSLVLEHLWIFGSGYLAGLAGAVAILLPTTTGLPDPGALATMVLLLAAIAASGVTWILVASRKAIPSNLSGALRTE